MPQLNFNALVSGGPQSVYEGFMQGQEIRNKLAQQEQARQLTDIQRQHATLQLQNATREQQAADEEAAAWKAGASDPKVVLQQLQQRGLGKAAMTLQGQLTKQQTDKLAQQKTTVDLVKHAANQVFANPGSAAQILQAFGQRTGIDMSDDLAEVQRLGGDPEAIKRWAAGQALEADKLLPKFQHFSIPGVGVQTGTVQQGVFTPGVQYKEQVSPGTRATIAAANKRAADRLNAETATGKLDPSTIDFVAETYRQTGQMPPLGMGKEAAKIRQQILTRAAELTMGGGISAADAAGSVVSNKQDVAGQSAAVKAFNTGVEGRSVRSFNTAIDHLDTMGKLADALQNNDIKAFNAVSQAFASQTGSAAPTNFDAAKAIVGGEVAKALTGTNMALKDREEIRDSLKRANSPAQLKGVVRTMQELMGGQLSSLRTQYESSTKRKDFDTKLSQRSKDVVKTLTPSAPVGGVAPPAGFVVD